MKLKTLALALLVVLSLGLVGCQATDIIANSSVTAFGEMAKAFPVEQKQSSGILGGGDQRILDTPSATLAWKTSKIGMSLDAAPFEDAGVNLEKLPSGMVKDGRIVVSQELQKESHYSDDTSSDDATSVYETIMRANRHLLSFHTGMGHFGFDLGDGNMFEWAKDMKENDKDIVFVLNPEPFIAAGLDVDKIEGWKYVTIDTMEMSGKPIKVQKLILPIESQDL